LDIEDVRLLIGPEMTRHGQFLDWDAPDDAVRDTGLPAAPLRQILLNLLLNAIQAAGSGGRVALAARREGDVLLLEVSDSGPGLSTDARARLLDSGPIPAGGGVGLRLVHDLVGGLDGVIETTRSGGMTHISLRLPRRSGADPC